MRSFTHINAHTVDEACSLLRSYKGRAVLNAGGTDLFCTLKAENLFEYPEAVINIKTVAGLEFIKEEGDGCRIGALTRLSDIIGSPLIKERYKVLREAARSVATPQIRNAATLGGNLCQDIRCWYYRYPGPMGGPIRCLRKGTGPCLAVKGDNRYHAILGGRKCFAVCPSDTAVALAALDGKITMAGPKGERRIAVAEFFGPQGTALNRDEMVTGIQIPAVPDSAKQSFLKFTLRKPVDFAIVSVACILSTEAAVCSDARIALGAVAPGPVRVLRAEDVLRGRPVDEHIAAEAAEKALEGAKPLSGNAYKIQIAKTLVRRAIMEVA
jgi:xanthine dehydrogenase YagS FAD-binding subunit